VQHFENDVPEGKKPQPNALSLATANEEIMDSEWILMMDADEFLSIKVGRGWITTWSNACPPKRTRWRSHGGFSGPTT
jgi:hypothetical protein